MRCKRWFVVLVLASVAAGCGPSGSAPPGSQTSSEPSADGWTVKQAETITVPMRASTYESFSIQRGESVRATVTMASAPLHVRLYVSTLTGQETTLGEKKDVQEAILEGKAPSDGTATLQIEAGKADTSVQYKLEKR